MSTKLEKTGKTKQKGKLLVKFVPLNENTIYSLINKKIRFSTVYDFNDLNELNKIILAKSLRIKCAISKLLDFDTKNELIEKIQQSHIGSQYLDELLKKIKTGTLSDINLATVAEHIGYLKTGIFCLSDILVFESDSAQVMFAHYADNLKGLALIYSCAKNNCKKVHYSCNDPENCNTEYCEHTLKALDDDDVQQYLHGKLSEAFLYKSKAWEYEKEYRLFNTPGAVEAKSVGIELKGIFYTQRLNSYGRQDKIHTIKKINEKFYEDKLFIKKIRESYSNSTPKRFFLLDGKSISKYLEQP